MRFFRNFNSLLILIISSTAIAYALPVQVAGRAVTTSPLPLESNGQLLLPASFLIDSLGMKVKAAKSPGTWDIASFGQQITVRKDSARYSVGSFTVQAAQVTRVIDGNLYVPVEMIMRGFGIMWDKSKTAFKLTPPGAVVSEVRQGIQPGILRMVLDLTNPTTFWVSQTPGEIIVDVSPPTSRPSDWGALKMLTYNGPMNPRVKIKAGPADWTRVIIEYNGSKPATVFTLGSPPRIVLDIPVDEAAQPIKPAPQVVTKPSDKPPVPKPATGTELAFSTNWHVRNFSTPRGQVRVFAMRTNPGALRIALASSTIRQRATVATIAKRYGAIAAVNGGYYASGGAPLGMLVVDGEWIKHPILSRSIFGITTDGLAVMGRAHFDGVAKIAGVGDIKLSGLNTNHPAGDSAIVYSRRWGTTVDCGQWGIAVLVGSDGTAWQILGPGQSIAPPENGYVISARGSYARALARTQVGSSIKILLETSPKFPALRYAVGAGPQLLRGGKTEVTSQNECFRADVCGIANRTAVGIDADGNILLVAAEATVAKGFSLSELSSVMKKLGCTDAMALDGGGSTTVVSNGRVINNPSGGSARGVSNAILVLNKSH